MPATTSPRGWAIFQVVRSARRANCRARDAHANVPATLRARPMRGTRLCLPCRAPRVPPLGHLTLPGHGQGSYPADGWRYETSTDPADVPRRDRGAAHRPQRLWRTNPVRCGNVPTGRIKPFSFLRTTEPSRCAGNSGWAPCDVAAHGKRLKRLQPKLAREPPALVCPKVPTPQPLRSRELRRRTWSSRCLPSSTWPLPPSPAQPPSAPLRQTGPAHAARPGQA